MIFTPRENQRIAIDFGKENPYCGLFLDMGLGKTGVTLTLIKFFLDSFTCLKPLIIAPKNVAAITWPDEIKKWDQFNNLTYSVITGDEQQRLAALRAKADIYILNIAFLPWFDQLNRFKRKWPFDLVILDESSKYKSRDSQRFKAVRRVRPKIDRLILLSGTPVPNGLMDLWAQIYLLDQGERLQKFIEVYRALYFHPEKKLLHGGHTYGINTGAEDLIFDKVNDICLSQKSEDWLDDLPDCQDIITEIELDDYTEYYKFRKEKILELPEKEITAFNASALYIKLLQYSNGAVYDNDLNHAYHVVNNAKLDALDEMIEALEGHPVLVFYQFQSDITRIKARIQGVVELKDDKRMKLWNQRKIRVGLMHAASTHGLNIQEGGNYIIWYGVGSNLEWYQQAKKRLHRPGQKFKVFNYHLITKNTGERKVYQGLISKTLTQDALFEALK